jgi:hypothetical protein
MNHMHWKLVSKNANNFIVNHLPMSKYIKATSIVKHKKIDVENVRAIMHKEYQIS